MKEKEILNEVIAKLDAADEEETYQELGVMGKICAILDKLPPDARMRIASWLSAKYAFGARDMIPTIPDTGGSGKRIPVKETTIAAYAAPGFGYDWEPLRKWWKND